MKIIIEQWVKYGKEGDGELEIDRVIEGQYSGLNM